MRQLLFLAYTLLIFIGISSCITKVVAAPEEEEQCEEPIYSKPSGAYPHIYMSANYYAGIMVGGYEIYCDTEGATIKYTTDGSIPNENSDTYDGNKILPYLHHTVVVGKARAYKEGFKPSSIVTVSYTDDGTSCNRNH